MERFAERAGRRVALVAVLAQSDVQGKLARLREAFGWSEEKFAGIRAHVLGMLRRDEQLTLVSNEELRQHVLVVRKLLERLRREHGATGSSLYPWAEPVARFAAKEANESMNSNEFNKN